MTEDDDLEDFLMDFEAQMEDLAVPVAQWASQLRPLLTRGMKAVLNTMDVEDRNNYERVKLVLSESFGIRPGPLGDRFWNATRPKGASFVNT